MKTTYTHRKFGPAPNIRPLETSTTATSQPPNIYRPRTSGPSPDIRPEARKSGAPYLESTKADLASPDIRPPARTSRPSGKPGHPARCLVIRPHLSAHSKRPRPMYPFAHLDYIYSSSSLFLGLAKDQLI